MEVKYEFLLSLIIVFGTYMLTVCTQQRKPNKIGTLLVDKGSSCKFLRRGGELHKALYGITQGFRHQGLDPFPN
jgi:hypothetical protein